MRLSRGVVSEVSPPGDRWPHGVRLEEIIVEVIEEKEAWLIELDTMPDHVHLLANSYFVATVGGAPLSVINRYVETQEDR
ncbi:MAG: REP-associated tyrosine transposase [Mycobacterium sp.]|nr:REP-associated tyrosine transposase [Mycobacterium sp.]MDT5400876.1 REP-associated tyrosine transposase [Mycobacterium sp.]